MPGADPKLIVTLEARLNKFEKQLQDAGKISERQVKNIESKFNKLDVGAGFTASLLKAGVAAFSLEKAIGAVLTSVQSVAKMGDVAERVGLTAEQLQELRFVVQQNGGELETANGAMERFANTMAKASQGAGYLAKVFKANGVAISKDMGQNLLSLFDLINNTEGAQNKLNLAAEAFGRQAGPQMVASAEGGAAAFLKQAQAAREAGAVLRNDVVAEARRLDDQWDKLVTTLSTQAKGYIIGIIPQINNFLTKLDELAARILPVLKAINQWNPVSWGVDKLTDMAGDQDPGLAGGASGFSGRTVVNVNKPRPTVLPSRGGADSIDAFQKAIQMAQKHTLELEAETAAIDEGSAAQARAKLVVDLETAAKEANVKAGYELYGVTEATNPKIGEMADKLLAAQMAAQKAKGPLKEFGRDARDMGKNLQNAAVEGLKNLEDGLVDVIMQAKTAKEAFKALVDEILRSLLKLAIRQGITGPLGDVLGNFLPTPRAAGGPVSANRPYLVGENGPELFMPSSSGKIVPNSVSGGRSASGGLNLQIVNYGGASIEPSEPKQNSDGSLSMVVMVDRLTAKNGSTPGTATNKMLSAQGVRLPLTRRA